MVVGVLFFLSCAIHERRIEIDFRHQIIESAENQFKNSGNLNPNLHYWLFSTAQDKQVSLFHKEQYLNAVTQWASTPIDTSSRVCFSIPEYVLEALKDQTSQHFPKLKEKIQNLIRFNLTTATTSSYLIQVSSETRESLDGSPAREVQNIEQISGVLRSMSIANYYANLGLEGEIQLQFSHLDQLRNEWGFWPRYVNSAGKPFRDQVAIPESFEVVESFLSAFEITNNDFYLDQAINVSDSLISRFWVPEENLGHFYSLGRLSGAGVSRDIPAVESRVWKALFHLSVVTGKNKYLNFAGQDMVFVLNIWLRQGSGVLQTPYVWSQSEEEFIAEIPVNPLEHSEWWGAFADFYETARKYKKEDFTTTVQILFNYTLDTIKKHPKLDNQRHWIGFLQLADALR